jgi:anti-sigma-K factor RskA
MTHDEIQADLSAFALGALDPDEQREVEQHLAGGCVACQRELAAWREVVGIMPLATAEADAPNLKLALLQQLQPSARAAQVLPRPRRPSRLIAALPLAVAALALLVFGVVRDTLMRGEVERQQQLVAGLRSKLDEADGSLQRLTTQLAAKEKDVASLRAALAAAEESLTIVRTPGLQLVYLKEAPKAPPAEAHVLISRDTHRALFYAFDLPPPPADKVYELWWITEKEGPVNAGLFAPNPQGVGRVDTTVPPDAGAIQAAAVTVEPAGGVPKPTGPMVLLGNVLKSS